MPMGFLSKLFGGNLELREKAKKQPNKCYVQFEDMPIGPLEKSIAAKPTYIETLKPLNVQASKHKYLRGCFYYSGLSDPVYYSVARIVNDSQVAETGIYIIDYSLLKTIAFAAGRPLSY